MQVPFFQEELYAIVRTMYMGPAQWRIQKVKSSLLAIIVVEINFKLVLEYLNVT